ncbi:ankyrin repeat ph and sec7 domain containing protein secg-related [Anaeramoeba flamelloides]|uniref:Ankyrin repeat ph and sec7 domain containing protein secg-related n=1 Tax=Anaeramoeba flamelloides TaxID=1746091 RepID=A0AAV7ZF23_9EUKA|nr:ankyrin repeat ph and sec7 domain containing protein secg-related [Anaeramoeba flamelloides]
MKTYVSYDQLYKLFRKNNFELIKSQINTKYLQKHDKTIDDLFQLITNTNPSYKTLKYLMTLKPNLEQEDDSGNTPLMNFFLRNNLTSQYKKFIDLFLLNGSNINHQNHFGSSILHLLVLNEKRNIRLFAEIISQGYDINLKDENGRTVGHLIMERYGFDFAYLLPILEKSLDCFSIEFYRLEESPTLISKPKEDIFTILRYLFQDQKEFTISQDRINKLLIDYEENNNSDSKIIAMLIESGANLDHLKDTQSLLFYYCKENYLFKEHNDILIRLIEKCQNINVKDLNGDGLTPFQYYCQHSSVHSNVIRSFLDNGADIMVKTPSGNNILHLLLESDLSDLLLIVKLIKRGINLQELNSKKESILHIYCQNLLIQYRILKYLFTYDIDIHLKSDEGKTAFLHLSENPNISFDMILLFYHQCNNMELLDNNEDIIMPFLKNQWRITEGKRFEIIHFLVNHGYIIKCDNYKPTEMIRDYTTFSYNILKLNRYILNESRSIKEDFKDLLDFKECTDCHLFGYNLHRKFLELRTKKPFEELEIILKNYKPIEIKKFIDWVYGEDQIEDKLLVDKICNDFQFTSIRNHYLKKDLRDAKFCNQSKDFSIIVGSSKIYVHKWILQARSSLFRMLFVGTKNKINTINNHSHFSFQTIKIFINYLYTNDLPKYIKSIQIIKELREVVDYFILNQSCSFNHLLDQYYGKFNNFTSRLFTNE